MPILDRARAWLRGKPPSQQYRQRVERDRRGNVTVHLGSLREEIEATQRLVGRAREEFLRTGRITLAGGAAGTWTFTNGARLKLIDGTFAINTDTFKMALLQSTSNIGASSTTYAGLTNEVANANGYTTGGASIALTAAGTTTVTVDITTDPVWTASGGSIVARFAVIYEVGGNVLCYALLDSAPADVTATSGNTLTVAANASGVFTLN